MQIKYLHPVIYKGYRALRPIKSLDDRLQKREKPLIDWEDLKKQGCSDAVCARITGMSRATYYRKKKRFETFGSKGLEALSKRPRTFRESAIPFATQEAVIRIRKEHPTYGKAKVTAILKRDHGITLSESSVGRILTAAIRAGRVRKYRAAVRPRKKRLFKGHAKRWSYQKPEHMGMLVQMDHMQTNVGAQRFYHFQAIDPISRMLVSEIYSSATSASAANFLEKVKLEMPFDVSSIQVDGGSEFMKHFEEKCKNDGIGLFVLPPATPKLNGKVERVNRTMREDFYEVGRAELYADTKFLRQKLKEKVNEYNLFRPHAALGFKTPQEYATEMNGKMKDQESQII
jgi:transposase InsO family protein